MPSGTKTQKPHIKLWAAFKDEFKLSEKGTIVLKNYYRNDEHRQSQLRRLLEKAIGYQRSGKLIAWHIYDQPKNIRIFHWNIKEETEENEV